MFHESVFPFKDHTSSSNGPDYVPISVLQGDDILEEDVFRTEGTEEVIAERAANLIDEDFHHDVPARRTRRVRKEPSWMKDFAMASVESCRPTPQKEFFASLAHVMAVKEPIFFCRLRMILSGFMP